MYHWSIQFYVKNASNVLDSICWWHAIVAHHSLHSFIIINSMKWTNFSFDAFSAIVFVFPFIRIWTATNTHNVHSTLIRMMKKIKQPHEMRSEEKSETKKISANGFLGYSFHFFPTEIAFYFFNGCRRISHFHYIILLFVFSSEYFFFFVLVFIAHSSQSCTAIILPELRICKI